MKTILLLIALACHVSAQEAATGDAVFRVKAARGYESVNLSPENGKVIGWTAGHLANVVGGGGAWGSITGTLSAQTDLQAALNAKQATITPGSLALSVLATDPLARANHTGTQSYTTISGLGTLATQSGTFSGTSSGTNTGDNATNTQYSGLAASKADLNNPTFPAGITLTSGGVVNIGAGGYSENGFVILNDSLTFSGELGASLLTGNRSFQLPNESGTFAVQSGALGTPTSGNFSSGTFTWPTFNQATTNSAGSLSISGQTGLLTITGLASTNRIKTVRDAADTILELGGSYTPSGTWTNMVFVTPNIGAATATSVNGLGLSGNGFTLTVPATGTAALLGTANIFTTKQTSRLTTNQAEWGYDSSNYLRLTVDSVGSSTLATTGTNSSITLTPSGTGTVIVPDGLGSSLRTGIRGTTNNTGFSFDGSEVAVILNGTRTHRLTSSGFLLGSGFVIRWPISGAATTAISEVSSGVLGIGNGTAADFSKDIKATNGTFVGTLGVGGTANANAILDAQSTTKAFMPPRMTKTQRDAIASPTAGMVVYQSDNTPGLRTYNGTNWMKYTEATD